MKCKDCPYHWADANEPVGKPLNQPYCHYQYNDGCAPCEVDETEYLNEEEQ